MASLKFVLLSKKPVQPLFCRFYSDSKSVYINQKILLHLEHWDSIAEQVKKSHPSFDFVSKYIISAKKSMFKKYYSFFDSDKGFNQKLFLHDAKTGSDPEFFSFCFEILSKIKDSGRRNTYYSQFNVINSFFTFMQKKDLFFSQFDRSVFASFFDYIAFSGRYSPNSIHFFFTVVKKFISLFCAHYDYNLQPRFFSNFSFPKKTGSIFFLSPGHVESLINLSDGLSESERFAKDLFLFSFFAGGLRFSDVLNVRNRCFSESLFSYTSIKTNVQVNLFLPDEALKIVSKYNYNPGAGDSFVFPFFDDQKIDTNSFVFHEKLNRFNSQVNHDLNSIGNRLFLPFPLTFHVARHSFATFALQKGLDIYKVSKILGHRSVKTTEKYIHLQSFSYSDIFK